MLVSEEIGKWVSADSPFPRFENRTTQSPRCGRCNKISLDQSPDPSSVKKVASGIVHPSGNSPNTCVCVGGGEWQHEETPNIPGAESGAEDKSSCSIAGIPAAPGAGPLSNKAFSFLVASSPHYCSQSGLQGSSPCSSRTGSGKGGKGRDALEDHGA